MLRGASFGVVLVVIALLSCVQGNVSPGSEVAASLKRDLDPVAVISNDANDILIYNAPSTISVAGNRFYAGPSVIIQSMAAKQPLLTQMSSASAIRATSAVSSVTPNYVMVVGEFTTSMSTCMGGGIISSALSSGRSAFYAEIPLEMAGCPKPDHFGEIVPPDPQGHALDCAVSSPYTAVYSGGPGYNLVVAKVERCNTGTVLNQGELGLIIGILQPASETETWTSRIALNSTGVDWTIKSLKLASGTDTFWVTGEYTRLSTVATFSYPPATDIIPVTSATGIWIATIKVDAGRPSVTKFTPLPDVDDGTKVLAIQSKDTDSLLLYHHNTDVIQCKLTAPPNIGCENNQTIVPGKLVLSASSFGADGLAGLALTIAPVVDPTNPSVLSLYDIDGVSLADISLPGRSIKRTAVLARNATHLSIASSSDSPLTSLLHYTIVPISSAPTPPTLPAPVPTSPPPVSSSPPPEAPAPPLTPVGSPTSPPPPSQSPVPPSVPPPTSSNTPPEPIFVNDGGMATSTKWAIVALCLVVLGGLAYVGYRFWYSKQLAAAQRAHNVDIERL